ncbi:MAG TPA: DUF1206 domain-containing protein [Egibacteraceae bacterium]|nr:DUF1206 domain-containing protein [Egibacteraceae bacterium]
MPSKTRGLARTGLVAKGVVYLLIAVLAARVAAGDGAQADSEGAIRTVAGRPGGTVLLGLLAVGLAGYALWNWRNVADADDWKARVAALGRGLLWTGLAVTAVRYALGSPASGNTEDSVTARVLDLPFGQWLVAGAGVAIGIVGAAVLRHLRGHRYLDHLRPVSRRLRQAIKAVTVTGLAGKAMVFLLAGAFLVRAAVRHTPRSGVGLDGALTKVADEPYGTYALAAVTVGLAAYGLWSLVRARYEDVERTDG